MDMHETGRDMKIIMRVLRELMKRSGLTFSDVVGQLLFRFRD
eukprot:CAMPEP_0195127948 /NCGR_PEP_ID=MMETSP0448-20130528/138152_1 /TAXON_ID=66468 /ORGANISM="Heterocapsa triquestra, Strain CCMP 448" /LENGTH=41 /DNA_ID= /DNA_START= /DNA_END= /DNA_ORIENTATION=